MKTNKERLEELEIYNSGKIDAKLRVAAWIILIFTVISLVVLAILSGVMGYKEISESGMPGGIPLSLQYALVLFFATLIAMTIITIIAAVFFWKPMKNVLEARKLTIENNIESASNANLAAEANWKEATIAKKEVKEEAKAIIAESKTSADKERREILDKTKDEQDLLIEKSREQIEKEKEQLKDDIRNEILSTSILAAEKILEKEIDENVNSKMVNELLDALK